MTMLSSMQQRRPAVSSLCLMVRLPLVTKWWIRLHMLKTASLTCALVAMMLDDAFAPILATMPPSAPLEVLNCPKTGEIANCSMVIARSNAQQGWNFRNARMSVNIHVLILEVLKSALRSACLVALAPRDKQLITQANAWLSTSAHALMVTSL